MFRATIRNNEGDTLLLQSMLLNGVKHLISVYLPTLASSYSLPSKKPKTANAAAPINAIKIVPENKTEPATIKSTTANPFPPFQMPNRGNCPRNAAGNNGDRSQRVKRPVRTVTHTNCSDCNDRKDNEQKHLFHFSSHVKKF